MVNLFKSIFGGSEQDSQSVSVSKPVDLTPAEYVGLRGPASTALRENISTGGPAYQGPLVAPITAPETNVLGQLGGMTGPGTTRANYLQDVLSGKYLGQGNPFLQQYIQAAQRPTLQGLEETLTRALPGRFTAAGQFTNPQGSSAFDRAAAIATRGTAQALSDIATNISFGAYEGERGRQQQATALSQAEVDTTIKNLQAQGLPRLISDLGIERGIALFQERTNKLLEFLRLAGGLGAPTVANEATSTSTSHGESTPGALAGVSNAFGKLFPLGMKLPG